MQSANGDYPRHQLVEALGQCGQQLRSTASMLDNYVTFLQNAPHATYSLSPQNMFQMFTPPSTGGQAAGGAVATAPNGVTAPAAAPAPTRGRKRRVADPSGEPEVDENGKKRRKRGEKKAKDPNAPKRPPSAYLIFQNEVRQEMKELYPDKPYAEVLHKISERWASMGDAQKKHYMDQTSDLRAKFEVNKAAYDAEHNADALAAKTPAAPVTTAPAVPLAPVNIPAATVSAPAVPAAEESGPSDDDEEASEASSAAAVSAAIDKSEASSESSDDPDSLDDSSDEEKQAAVSPPAAKKSGKPALSKSTRAPRKLVSSTKENKAKDKKSKKEVAA